MSRFDSSRFLQPRVWGGSRLPRLFGTPTATEPIGEAWTTSDHPVHRSIVADGGHKGESLRSLMKERPDDLIGACTDARFPWLVKFLDCNELLSVQVHPDKAAVARLVPGEGSKTEAWFVLEAKPGARVWAGLKAGVDEAKLRAALANKTVADCLHTFVPKPGDCIFLPAGTVHAVGGGVLMAEIQETSDVTFRLYDWDRLDDRGHGRQLHLEEAIASIHWDAGPVTPIAARDVLRVGDRAELVRCDAFVLEFCWVTKPTELIGGRMQMLIVVGGDGTWSDGRRLSAGTVVGAAGGAGDADVDAGSVRLAGVPVGPAALTDFPPSPGFAGRGPGVRGTATPREISRFREGHWPPHPALSPQSRGEGAQDRCDRSLQARGKTMRVVLNRLSALRQKAGVGHYAAALGLALETQLDRDDAILPFPGPFAERDARRLEPGAADAQAELGRQRAAQPGSRSRRRRLPLVLRHAALRSLSRDELDSAAEHSANGRDGARPVADSPPRMAPRRACEVFRRPLSCGPRAQPAHPDDVATLCAAS